MDRPYYCLTPLQKVEQNLKQYEQNLKQYDNTLDKVRQLAKEKKEPRNS